MARLFLEFVESVRIAAAQIRANKMRSALTALGVVIGIVAVTLMGTAIKGIDIGFQSSLSMLGDDILYVQKWPWGDVDDWWNYVNRPPFNPEDADAINRIVGDTPNSLIDVAIPAANRNSTVRSGDYSVNGVFTIGTTADYGRTVSVDFDQGRLFNTTEANAGRPVAVLGYDVARALFPGRPCIGETVRVAGAPFQVIGVLGKQGSFLGLFSFDNQMIVPLNAYRKLFAVRDGAIELHVKIRDKNRTDEAREELQGVMRRVRGLLPTEPDNFTINAQEAFKAQLDPVKKGIAFAGLFITGLALFVGAIGIMNITFVSVKERTREIGTRKALGARRRTILMQFLVESASVSGVGGVAGLGFTYLLCLAIHAGAPSLPLVFSPGLVVWALVVSVVVGVVSGFIPAVGASRLDPVTALRYE